MKRCRILLILFASLISCRRDDVQPVNKITLDDVDLLCDILPPGYYGAVRFTSQNTAFIVSNSGEIFKTADGGTSWSLQNSGTELHLYDLYFSNDLNGYVVGGDASGVILKTSNGGETWSSTTVSAGLSGIHFISPATGFAVGNGIFLKTADGGETWNESNLGFSSYRKINFFDEKTGLLTAMNSSGERVVLRTTDGGSNWEKVDNVSLGLSTVTKIQILGERAYVITNSGMFKTSDRGNTWQRMAVPAASVHFINEHQALAVGEFWPDFGFYSNGIIYVTNDGGKSWQERHFQTDEFYSIEDVDFANDTTALAVGHTLGCVVKLRF